MDSKFIRRIERLEQPARDKPKFWQAVAARATVGRKVDNLIAWLRRGDSLDLFGSPVPDGPAEPSPTRDRLTAKLQDMHDRIRRISASPMEICGFHVIRKIK